MLFTDNGNTPARPFTQKPEYQYQEAGLTKREHFAIEALQGLLANSEPKSWNEEQWYSQMSKQAVNHADALLKELSK